MSAAPTPPPKRRSWFSVSTPLLSGDDIERGAFTRMWQGLMSARVVVALTMLGLHLAPHRAAPMPTWALPLCLAYLAVTLLTRLLAAPRGPGQPFDVQWWYAAGADLAVVVALQSMQPLDINYTPLLVLPVLITAVMGSRQLALGTAALATLALLGHTVWNASAASWNSSADIAQAGLTGAGLLALSLLIAQLSTRLAGEEALVRRSRNEAQIQSLVNNLVIEALSDGVLVVDSSYTVRTANPAAHQMLAGDSEVTPDQFSLLDNPAWVQLAHVARLTFADGPIDAVEITLHHEDRPNSHLQARTERTPSLGGGDRLCVMFLQDLREMEARLRTEKLAAMGRMSAAVAHEIRNPLAAIAQANALLEEDLTAPVQQRLVAMVRQNTQRLNHIVEDILNVVRVQDVSDFRAVQTLAFDEAVQAFCREWRDQQRAGPRLAIHLQAPEIQVQFAREDLRRVLINLLDNAARYASPKAGAIQVSTQVTRHGPVRLMVWSDSQPMEASVLRHMFEPFFSSEARSSGLGLFICRELCERHGAVIGYQRTPRQQDGGAVDGNEFFVHLRRVHDTHSTLPPEGTSPP
ncbi:MAG: PAS domain-containing sensor histidine kinase [Burkholderiaceae bacterium]|jgi:two-component system sensor histidine kinase PilS (NtrC family)|nr:PAS domain-containing sensor histidine kinase [Burkholderiaceae bacterium]